MHLDSDLNLLRKTTRADVGLYKMESHRHQGLKSLFTVCSPRTLTLTITSCVCACRTLAKDYHVLLPVLLILSCFTNPTVAQTYRPFPSLFNVARYKPIFTDPSQSTCGVPTETAYCRSSTLSESVVDCRHDVCVQTCQRRTSLPQSANLLKASNYGSCVTTDNENVRPGSTSDSFAAVFSTGASCYVHPIDTINLGANGAFTITFWIWQQANNFGTIIEKYTSTRQTIFRLRMSAASLVFQYRSSVGQGEVVFDENIPNQAWYFIAVQVYDTTISYFVNGLGVGYSARGTRGLVAAVMDTTGIVRLGQTGNGTDQFNGRIQDAAFFMETLTNREISEVFTGVLPAVFIQPECRCPPTHPRVKPIHTHFCIKNGVADNLGDEVLRLNNNSHPLQYLNDGDSNSVWVSSFLDDVTVTVDLGDLFQVFYVVIQFYSPQPKVLTIERRRDLLAPWQPWQLYAEDCTVAFSMVNNGPLTDSTSVNCLQFGTNGLIVPYSKGNVTFNLLSPAPQPRPGHNDFYNMPELNNFVMASQVRIRMQGHYHTNHFRHQYYGVYEFIVTGRCQCHGHAASCDMDDLPYQCVCSPESNTEGDRCERCKPLYNNKPYREGTQSTAYNCKPCNCHGHADSCVYDSNMDAFPGEHDRGEGGVCGSCQHNTAGRWCEVCRPLYYRPFEKSLFDADVCSPCECHAPGVTGDSLDCEKNGGQCPCKAYVSGRRCDECRPGYYNLQASNPVGCEECFCDQSGTLGGDVSCMQTAGRCACKQNVRNDKCDACEYGYYGLSAQNPLGCDACDCHPVGSLDIYCNPDNGQCNCKPNVGGRRCDECQAGFYNLDGTCQPCNCNVQGTQSGTTCDKFTGQCICKPAVAGQRCDQCIDGYFNLGADFVIGCVNCGCDSAGTNNQSSICNKISGDCECRPNVQGRSCNQCKPNTFNLTAENPEGCELCGCDPTGTLQGDMLFPHQLTCDQNMGQCTCLSNREGLKCDRCKQGYYLSPVAGGGCLSCDCNQRGTILLSFCDTQTGQCNCKLGTGIGGRRCDSCQPGYFGFSVDGCMGCGCDLGGSINTTSCDPNTGQCECKQFTTSRQCGACVPGTSNLEADNPFGCSKMPDQQPPPNYEPLNSTTLRLYWSPPDYPNGVILRYYLYRNGGLIATINTNVTIVEGFNESTLNPDMEYTDINLQPFTQYTYNVVAENDFGTTASPSVTFQTPPGPPTGTISMFVQGVTSSGALFSWTSPPASNGILQYYELNSTTLLNNQPRAHYKGLGLNTRLTDLEAYMYYVFTVAACTNGGCLTSDPQVVVTQEAMPQGQRPPNVTVIGSMELYVFWTPTENPNGVIIYYELWMRGAMGPDGSHQPPASRIFHPAGRYDPLNLPTPQPLPAPATNFTVTNLEPFKDYEFQVISQNSLGQSASQWVIARTGESAPEFMPAPALTALSSTSLNVTWNPPSVAQAHGDIVLYRVYHYKPLDLVNNPFAPPNVWTLVALAEGPDRHAVVSNLAPFSDQVVMVEGCNLVGCVNSSQSVGRTLAGVPSGIPLPEVDGYNSSSMYLSWTPPSSINGPEPYYIVRRVETALNKPPPDVSRGTRFPGLGYYLFPPETIPQGVGFTGIELWFKTNQREGLIMFASSEGGQEEFIALQLRAGRPWFLYDPQGCRTYVTVDLRDGFEQALWDANGDPIPNATFTGTSFADGRWHHLVARRIVNNAKITLNVDFVGCAAIVTTTDDEGLPYNNYEWHHLRAIRRDQQGSIVLDNRWTGEKDTSCATGNIIGRNTGVYLGGLPDDYILQRMETDVRAQVNNINFQGCIRDVKILTQVVPEEVWTPLNWSTVVQRYSAAPDWEGCPENLDPDTAIHFLGTGYVVYENGFPLERSNLRIPPSFAVDLRTERQNGILFYGYGVTGYFHLVQLVAGDIVWMLGTPYQRRTLVFPSSTTNVCDGQWHFIFFKKSGGTIEIQVDYGFPVKDGSGPLKIENLVEIASDMYVGGIPDTEEARRPLRENNLDQLLQPNFGGCLRGLERNQNRIPLTSFAVDVYMDGCPSPGENTRPCQTVSHQVVYNGTGNYTYDTGLDSFTEYIYQVEAVNAAGSSVGRWQTGRTREGPPEGLTGPYDVNVIDGFTINARWQKPTGYTGQITKYILRAYDRDDPMELPVEMEFAPEALLGQMHNAVPYSNYSLYLVACTFGGCTESADSVDLFTMEEAPQEVSPPVATTMGGTFLVLGWTPPAKPNGVLTGYVLYMEGGQIYAGNELTFNVTGLNMFNSYRFSLKACSRVGCTDSETVSIATAQLPPTAMSVPRLTVLGTRSIRAEWSHPDQPNGRLESYVLYASTDAQTDGAVVYNNTETFLASDITNLLPGTTYYIRVAACTGGGCTISPPAVATTFESAPEGLPDPVITAVSPTELIVTWEPPAFPNGLLTQYRLFQNGLLIFSHASQRQYTMSNLQPWSLHLLRVEACTSQGCGSSAEVSARTLEAPPVGVLGLDVQVIGQRSVSVLWNGVQEANGVVYYDVYFEGLFYMDRDRLDFRNLTDRRSLLQTQDSGVPVTVDALIPYSVYYVQVNASNTVGHVLSNIKQAVMPPGSPDGVLPPTLTSPDSTSVQVVWKPVARPNAPINPAYQLQFKETTPNAPIIDLFSQPTTSNSYLKTGLRPFTEYEFRVAAINPYGSTNSQWVTITTRQDRPTGVDPPRILNITARSADLEWDPPLASNGILVEYRVYKNNAFQQTLAGNETSTRVDDLLPFSVYTFQVEACTLAGCTKSNASRAITTLQDKPEGLPALSLVSQTPTSVLIVWSEPAFSNGVILQYGIERRSPGGDTRVIATFLAEDPKQYMDQSPEVMPYTTYEYRLTAETSIGRSEGPWGTVTTKPSRPGGVQSPTVRVLSPTSMEIMWLPPIRPNGRMESYVIALPEPRYEVSNVTQNLYLLAEDLIPFTNYSVTVTACSEGGCTSSQPTVVSTSPSVPSGQAPPVGTPMSQTYISVLWLPPARPNGPNLKYELSRMKIREPLNPLATDFGLWMSLFLGNNTYYDDRGLTLYTTYQYRVTVYNNYGHTVSAPSADVTTFGGTPTAAPVVVLTPGNHTSFMVSWNTPPVEQLQGGVSKYIIDVTDGTTPQQYEAGPDDVSVTATQLLPNTEYQVTVTIEVHGGGRITSEPGSITTMDGAPDSLDPPIKQVINETTVRISWAAPSRPNGDVLGYNLYVDGGKIETGQTTPGSYLLTNLQPYTIYRVQVEVCTVFACIRSPEITVTTAESIPVGVYPPTLNVQGPYSVSVTWVDPLESNGVILRYELQRKTRVPCSEIDKPDPAPSFGKCTYLECGILESFCGDQCYSGPKTCCAGTLYDNIQGYECCGTTYIPRRSNPTDVCCGGTFHTKLANHMCCGSKYVELAEGEICCADLTQDRVDIGQGDTCCGSVPYMASGAQICCNGGLYASYEQQCCGGDVVSSDLVCCGNGTRGRAYQSNDTNMCCGSEYVQTDVSVCCGDESGDQKTHIYATPDAKLVSNEKCCSTERISSSLSCCNGNGYNPLVQSCADVSSLESGCGSGVICPSSQESTSFCNRCNFDRSSHKCGSYTAATTAATSQPQYIEEPPHGGPTGDNIDDGTLCLTDPVKIYTGNDQLFMDESLRPYTEYHYAVTAINGAGEKSSEFIFTTTAQTLPEGVSDPVALVRPEQLDTIHLTWDPPKRINGAITSYVLYRDGIEIFRDPQTREYRDNNAILPYQTYKYRLRVCNGAGCVDSMEVPVATLQARPDQVVPPTVSALSPSTLQITWVPPQRPNGYISMYRLYELTALGMVADLASDFRDHTLTDLQPYTEYVFVLTACTDAGCTNSSQVIGRTLQDRPMGLDAPIIVIVDANTVELYWKEPDSANGIITAYTLYKSTTGSSYSVSYQGLALNYTDMSVQPFAMYWYKVQAETVTGGTNSTVLNIEIPQITPQFIQEPQNVTVISPYAMIVSWEAPQIPNGIIDQYRVLLNAGTKEAISRGFGPNLQGQVDGLMPYTEYSVRIQACIQGIQNGCGTGPGVMAMTFEAAPEGQQAPSLEPLGPKIIKITWEPPERPNGVITTYRVQRRQVGIGTGNGILIALVDGDTLEFINSAVELQPYTEYEYKITAVNSKGEAASPWVGVQTLESTPEGMNPASITAVGAYSISLSWSPPQLTNGRILTYKIEYRSLSPSDPTAQGNIKSVTVESNVFATSISGLTPFTPYEIRVTAANSAGSISSAWSQATTSQAAPANVSPFTVERISTGTSVILRWDPPGKPNGVINNYLIYEADNVNAVYQGLNREFEMRRLDPFTEYTVQLEACTQGGCARSPIQKFVTAEIAPGVQPSPTLGNVNSSSVVIGWVAPINPNGKIISYEVLRDVSTTRQRRQVITQTPNVIYKTTDTDKEEYEYVDKDIEAYNVYYYSIRTKNSAGSTTSEPLRVEIPPGSPNGLAPPIVSQIPNKHDELLITWSPPGKPNGVLTDYQLQRNDSVPWSFDPENPREFTDTGLMPHTVYSYTITACTQGGCTTSTATVQRTPQAAPMVVDPPQLSTVNASAIRVTWTRPVVLNGEITEYQLMVNDTTVYRGLALFYVATNLQPFQAYTFMVTACTSGGCTNSEAVIGRPDEDVPRGMQSPILRVLSSIAIEITWQPPDFPNGIITSYELRRDGVLIFTTTLRKYSDYEVQPGTTYSYTVTAYNSRGSTSSQPSSTTTYASSPLGLRPPELEAVSATSVRATWLPPLNPNGELRNYTLYRDTKPEYSGLQLVTLVQDLDSFSEYSFRVQACTLRGCTTSEPVMVRTLEAAPQDLTSPKLTPMADSNGAHTGVLVEWAPPRKPNGVIIRYEVYRRMYVGDLTGGDGDLISSGQAEAYEDNDPVLEPFTQYQYRVIAYNSQDLVTSEWELTRTREAPPQGVPAPTVKTTTATTITLELQEPEKSNGYINGYKVYLNNIEVVHRLSLVVIIGERNPLMAFTEYTVYIEACTAGGCTPSPSVTARTLSQSPLGLAAPIVHNITASSVDVYWVEPADPNGEIIRYELSYRQICPYPYADPETSDLLTLPCTSSRWLSAVSGPDVFSYHVQNLEAYTTYEFRVEVANSKGAVTAATEATTEVTEPVYSGSRLKITTTGNAIGVDWIDAFKINGELNQFTLYRNSTVEYIGTATKHNVLRENLYAAYSFYVIIETNVGRAQTPRFYFDPSGGVLPPTPDNRPTTEAPPPDPTVGPVAPATKPIYQEIWFIIVMAIVALLLLFIGVALCLHLTRHKRPYIRERLPLPPRHEKSNVSMVYNIDPYDSALLASESPAPVNHGTLRSNGSAPFVGYINPAYSHLSAPSHSESILDLNMDKLSHKSSKWDDEDSLWDGNIPAGHDSGLHSLAYGDDYDADSDRPISVLKEHTMFTDTHL